MPKTIRITALVGVMHLAMGVMGGLTPPFAHAQLLPVLGGQRAGTATAQFLKIGVGARAVGMGEAFVAVANDASALYWNPAGIVQFAENDLVMTHVNWLVDIRHEFVGYVHHVGEATALGISVTALHTDDMEETTEYQPFGTGRYVSFGDLALGITVARKMTDRFSFGGTVKVMEETLAELKTRGILVDFGTFYWTGYGSSRFSVAVSNFGPQLSPGGTVVRSDDREVSSFQRFSPPIVFRVGFATELVDNEEHRVTAAAQLNHPNDNAENVTLGGEYLWRRMFALRGGYKANVDEESFTFGAGMEMSAGPMAFVLDYAYTGFGRLGSANRIGVNFKF